MILTPLALWLAEAAVSVDLAGSVSCAKEVIEATSDARASESTMLRSFMDTLPAFAQSGTKDAKAESYVTSATRACGLPRWYRGIAKVHSLLLAQVGGNHAVPAGIALGDVAAEFVPILARDTVQIVDHQAIAHG